MSKRKYWGRFTAMGIAGLTAVSSMAVVADAALTVTKVYEFTYNGIKAIPRSAAANNAATDNKFIVAADASAAKTNGKFEIKSSNPGGTYDGIAITLGDFSLSTATSVTNKDTNDWVYSSDGATSVTIKASTVKEVYGKRDASGIGDGTEASSYYFKSKSERDAALTQIQNKIKADYTAMYNKALSALRTDLNNANTAVYQTAELALRNTRDSDIATAKSTYESSAKDAAAKTTYNTAVATANETYRQGMIPVNAKKAAMTKAAAEIVKEFTEVYAPTNYLWNLTDTNKSSTNVGFILNDSAPEVTISVVGGVLDIATDAEYTPVTSSDPAINLNMCSYRTADAYTTPTRYAFKGEIALTTKAVTPYYEVGASWVRLPDQVQGSDNNSGASGNTGTTNNNTTSTVNTWYPTAATYRMSGTRSYLGLNGYYYTSEAAANLYGTGASGTSVASNYDSSRPYFSADTGLYYSSDSGMARTYKVENAAITGNSFYNSATGKYYVSESAARSANSSGTITGYTRATGSYFNSKTGYYYSTLEAAANASSINDVLTSGGSTVSASNDPYYYYYLQQQYNNLYGTGATTNRPSTSTVPAGSVSIYGTTSSRYAGWNNVLSYISSSARRGSTVKLDMNEEGTVPSQIVAAAKNRNITLRVVNDNGAYWTIAPGNVYSASDFNSSIVYNTKNIKSSLVKKAKKVNAGTVSTAQVTVGGNYSSSLGFTAGVTVKLPAKRSGCTVKAYRLDGSRLVCEARSKVQSTGAVTLNLDTAGSYLLVVID